MIEEKVMASDGNARTITYKQFGDEIRIYRVEGDITNTEALAEIAQDLCFSKNGVTKVTMKI